MIRLIAAGLALLGLAAACGGNSEEAAPPATTAPYTGAADAPAAKPFPPAVRSAPKQTKVLVTVVDGDTHRRVTGARVVIGKRGDYANTRGLASVKIKRRTALPVRVSKPGYAEKVIRLPFKRKRQVTVRLYRDALQWTMYGANNRRTQAPPGIKVRPPFRVVWSRGVGSLVEFPAVVADGVAYVGNYKGHIYALNMRNGAVLWQTRPSRGKMASSPAIVGDDLVVHGMDGIVRVLDRSDGRLRWHFRVGSPIESSPIVSGGLDYFGAWNGRVYALDLKRRKLRWSYRTGYKITSSAAIAGRTLYIGDYGGRLHALATRTGKRRFVRSVNGRVYGTPAVAAGRVFVPSSTGNSLTAFSTSGRYLWRVGTGGYVYSSPAVWAGRVFFGSYNGRLYSVAAKSGRVLWSVGTGGPVSGAAVVVAGVAYAGSTWGRITGVDARSGRVVLRFPHGEYVPVSGNGRRLLLHGYSRVWAVEPKSMKKWIAALCALILLVGGVVVGYVVYKREEAADVRGSSTEEFVTTEEEEPLPPPPAEDTLGVVWPLFGYGPERHRVGPSELKPPFRRVWTFRARQLLEFPPVIGYGRLYFTNNSGVMFAVNAKTGKRAWKKRVGRCVAATPAVGEHTVFQAFMNRPPCNNKAKPGRLEGEVIAFATGFGKIRWRTRIGPTESSPLLADGRVYVGDWRGRVYALDEQTGRVHWTFQGKGRIKGAITKSGNRLFVATYDGYLYAIRASTGKVIWRTRSQDRLGGRGQFYSTPTVAYGRVYIGSTDGKVYSFGAASGKLRWSQGTGGYVYASPAVWRKTVYVGSYSDRFYALDAATGDVKWRFQAKGDISGSATVLNGVVYFSTFDELTYALDARTGKLLWTFRDGKYAGVVADAERLYLVGHARVYGMVER